MTAISIPILHHPQDPGGIRPQGQSLLEWIEEREGDDEMFKASRVPKPASHAPISNIWAQEFPRGPACGCR